MNIPQNPWFFAFLSAVIISVSFVLTFALPTFAKAKKRRYDFLCDFPMELYAEEGVQRSVGLIGTVLACLSFIASYCMPLLTSDLYPQMRLFLLFIFGFACFAGAMLYALFSVRPTYPRAHILFFALFGGASIVTYFLSGIAFLHLQAISSSVGLIFAVIFFVLAAATLGVQLNPKLKNWAKLDSKPSEDGTVIVSRPRPFVLAFSEWILIGIAMLSAILFPLGIFILNSMTM